MELSDEGFHFNEALRQMERFNTLGYTEDAEKEKQHILRELFAEVGEGTYIQAPYHAMLGGHNVHLGKNVYVNFNATFVDDANIYIGDAGHFLHISLFQHTFHYGFLTRFKIGRASCRERV